MASVVELEHFVSRKHELHKLFIVGCVSLTDVPQIQLKAFLQKQITKTNILFHYIAFVGSKPFKTFFPDLPVPDRQVRCLGRLQHRLPLLCRALPDHLKVDLTWNL